MKPTGLFSVRLAITDKSKIELFVNSLKQFIIGVSWGGHESLVFPALSFDEERTKTDIQIILSGFISGWMKQTH